MSVTVTKAEGVTVFTLTSDPQSSWPPLCQIFKGLCYSPVCCSVSQQLKRIQRTSQSVLGTLQIMVGLLSLGFAAILLGSGPGSGWQMDSTKFPIWLGVLFIVFGIMCILSEKYPSPCLVILTVVLNLAGVAFAITAIVLYSINLAETSMGGPGWYWLCHHDYYYWNERDRTAATPSPEKNVLQEKCLEAQELAQMLVLGINIVLIILSALEFCVVISSVVLGIKALRNRQKESNKVEYEPRHLPVNLLFNMEVLDGHIYSFSVLLCTFVNFKSYSGCHFPSS